MAELTRHPGNYRYLAGDGRRPFCQAVIAEPGYEIVRAEFERLVPWRDGFAAIERHLQAEGRPRQALCSVELRCKEAYTPAAFDAFNEQYAAVLADWGLIEGKIGSTTRTNVAPSVAAPGEQSMYAFSYAVPSEDAGITFVISGAPEREGVGDLSPNGLRAKVRDIVEVLGARLKALDQGWPSVSEVAIYTAHDALAAVVAEQLPPLGPAAVHGLRWYPSYPPITGLELEIDARRIRRREIVAGS